MPITTIIKRPPTRHDKGTHVASRVQVFIVQRADRRTCSSFVRYRANMSDTLRRQAQSSMTSTRPSPWVRAGNLADQVCQIVPKLGLLGVLKLFGE